MIAEPGHPDNLQERPLLHSRGPGLAGAAAASALRLQGLGPVADEHTRLLVLGSFPGVASLQVQQYYGHPRNHFWPILGQLLGEDLAAMPYPGRLQRLLHHGVGLWDVYAACRRPGSLDSAISQAEPNDLAGLVARLPRLVAIVHNGGESARAMRVTGGLGVAVHRLPSTSPANAGQSAVAKLAAWRAVFGQHGLGVA